MSGTITKIPVELTLLRMIEAAGKAPSPDNNQPWAFRAENNRIDVLYVPKRGIPSDVDNVFAWAAMGCAIENLVLAASTEGRKAVVEYQGPPFPADADGVHVASIQVDQPGVADPLAKYVDVRVTNRRPYQTDPLGPETLRQLESAVQDPDSSLSWIHSIEQRSALARLVVVADRVRFEYQPFHAELHHVLRYSADEARSTGDGLDLKSLEIPSMAGPLLRFLRSWTFMRIANALGISRVFAQTSVDQIRASGTIGLLTTSNRSDVGLLESWRGFQRLWLASTKAEVALQPMGALPLFLTKLQAQGDRGFHPAHAERIRGLVEPFHELFPKARGRFLVMLFRLGHALKPPSGRSYRLPLERIVLRSTKG